MMSRNLSKVLVTLVFLASSGTGARAQFFGLGAGSTVEGDYLRGVGAAAQGMGFYNLYTAQANSINVDTAIRLNEYMFNVAKNENREAAKRRAFIIQRNRENYEQILERIRENPEDRDVVSGDALNSLMKQLLDPKYTPSSFRVSPVPLPGETIRRVPFLFAPENAAFSMRRLVAKGQWPVGLRGERFATSRRAYERAVDEALEQQIEGKLSREAILNVEAAILALRDDLERVITPSADKVYIEARDYLARLEASKELLKRQAIEKILGDLDKYSGATVSDLLVFMQKWNLRFGMAEIGDERKLYPELYAALRLQLDLVGGPDDRPGK